MLTRSGKAIPLKETLMRKSSFLGIPKIFAVGIVALALSGGAYAFTASNTVGQNPAGMGESGTVTGYTASSVVWTPDSTNPTLITSVSFALSTVTAATVVYGGSDSGSAITWSSACTHGTITAGSATYTCTFSTEPTSASVTKLAVSAAN
jgi:hypothetical protein